MAVELIALGGAVGDQLSRIAERGPQLVPAYQKKLTDRIQALVQEQGVTIESNDLAREVAILADRSDISEEVVRLRADLKQYSQIIEEPASPGPKARVRSTGNGSRNQHDRLEGKRRRDQPICR